MVAHTHHFQLQTETAVQTGGEGVRARMPPLHPLLTDLTHSSYELHCPAVCSSCWHGVQAEAVMVRQLPLLWDGAPAPHHSCADSRSAADGCLYVAARNVRW